MQIAHGLLNDPGLMIAAIQNGKIFPRGLLLKAGSRNFHRNVFSLSLVVGHRRHADRIAGTVL